ncbi:MAG: pyridoxal phosphate-dependent aminotransferase, partial [Candidatus Omnitrophica bacterium]|nr:pyridoxal phosphate-dependent aminotransferase [Candidatus Omnitrophota bacterium]
GKDIINFGAGEPDFDTPDFIKDAAVAAIKSGFTKYTPTTGTPELKKAICDKFRKDNSLEYAPNQIVVSCGAKHSIFNVVMALVDPGDEVIIPMPYWVSYPEMVNLAKGCPRFIKTRPENNFKFSAKDLEENISSKTKLLLLNSPSNPTGCVYSRKELEEIASVCVKNKIFVLSDEIYEKLIYDSEKHVSIASLDKDIYNLAITVNGLSKSYSMTGWRIGYFGAPVEIAEGVSRLQDHSTSNPASISQAAAIAALSAQNEFCDKVREEFQKRRDYCISRFKKIEKIKAVVPKGAFYIFLDISKTRLDSATFANRILEDKFVSLIPGAGFGMDEFVRISFATSMEQLQKGIDRIEEWVKQ